MLSPMAGISRPTVSSPTIWSEGLPLDPAWPATDPVPAGALLTESGEPIVTQAGEYILAQ